MNEIRPLAKCSAFGPPTQTRLLRRRVLVRSRTDEALFLGIKADGTDVVWGPQEDANDYVNNAEYAFERARERGGEVVHLDTEERITVVRAP
jgi:hypothetical protein